MKVHLQALAISFGALLVAGGDASARGFGGYRGGGGGAARGYGGGSWSGDRFGGSGGYSGRSGGFSESGSRSFSSGSGARGSYGSESWDRSWSGSRGGSISSEGERGYAAGPGGVAAGRTRDTTVTGPDGRSYTGGSEAGFAAGPGGVAAGRGREGTVTGFDGRTASGGSREGFAAGPGGWAAGGARWGDAAGSHFATDGGLARYAGYGAAGAGHVTALWSGSDMAARAGYVRGGFGYYRTFTPGWYAEHPAAWGAAVGWTAGAAWATPTFSSVAGSIGLPAEPVDYDYGNNVVYQDNSVYIDGSSFASADQYTQQAQQMAARGQAAQPAATDQWQPLGVFALVQGQDTSSNTIFQLAVNKDGVIRGNYYDGLMNTTTPVYGSVDKSTQRAAWSIGENKNTVFEAGVFNLTRDQTPVLVHVGKDRTQQWLLVRMKQPSNGGP